MTQLRSKDRLCYELMSRMNKESTVEFLVLLGLAPIDNTSIISRPVSRGPGGATGASAKLRLSELKSLLKIDCGPNGLEDARFLLDFAPWAPNGALPLDPFWGLAPTDPSHFGATAY